MSYDEFTSTGTYQLAVYAMDANLNVSSPSPTSVTVDSPLRKRAVIVAAISPLLIITCGGFGLSPAHIIKTTPNYGVASIAAKQNILCPGKNGLICTPVYVGASASAIGDDSIDRNSGNQSSSSTDRPDWALPWMPTWLITLRPRTQFLVGLILYIFHLRILTQHQITLCSLRHKNVWSHS